MLAPKQGPVHVPVDSPPPAVTPRRLVTSHPVVTPRPVSTSRPVVTPRPVVTSRPVVTPRPVNPHFPVTTPRRDFVSSGREELMATPKRVTQLARTPTTKRLSELSVDDLRLSNTPGSLKKPRTSRRTPKELSEKITELLTPGWILAAFTNQGFKSHGCVQVLGSRQQNGKTWIKLCDSQYCLLYTSPSPRD